MSDTRIQRRNPQVQFYVSALKEFHKKSKIYKIELEKTNQYLEENKYNDKIQKFHHMNFKYFLQDRIKVNKELIKICSTNISKYTC